MTKIIQVIYLPIKILYMSYISNDSWVNLWRIRISMSIFQIRLEIGCPIFIAKKKKIWKKN